MSIMYFSLYSTKNAALDLHICYRIVRRRNIEICCIPRGCIAPVSDRVQSQAIQQNATYTAYGTWTG